MSVAKRRFWGVLGTGIFAGILLIQAVSGPDAGGGGPRALKLAELQPGQGIVVNQVGEGFSLRASLPVDGPPQRILDLNLPPGFASNFHSYALAGEVTYRTPEGSSGYLEAVSVASGAKEPDVARTLGHDLQAPLSGYSMWRHFALPSSLTEGSDVPTKIELNVSLPAGGTVELRDLQLVAGWGSRPGAWFSMEENRRMGAALGILIGLWGTLLGIGRGVWPERSASAVLASCFLWILGGVLCLAALGWAYLADQPWWIRQQLAFCGVLMVGLGGAFLGGAQLGFFPDKLREPGESAPMRS